MRVLTVNLAFWAIAGRDARLDHLAETVRDRRIDIVALQEVAGGLLAFSADTAADLQRRLPGYARRTGFGTQIGRLMRVGNAVLSRCAIGPASVTDIGRLPEIRRLGLTIEVGRQALAVEIVDPALPPLRLVTSHLCAGCSLAERDGQLGVLLGTLAASPLPTIFAGDLNIDRHRDGAGERFMHDRLADAGLHDAMIEARGTDRICTEPATPAADCTTGVTLLNGPSTTRVDYVLVDDRFEVVEAVTLFNPGFDPDQSEVSDHAGVLATLALRQSAVIDAAGE